MPHLKLFLLALSFYTRLPYPQTLDYKQLPQAAVYLPLVGWLVGGMLRFSILSGRFALAADYGGDHGDNRRHFADRRIA